MYLAVSIAIFVTMALALTRALLGPSIYDRVLAVNMLGTKTVLLLAVLAFLSGRPDFLDLALTYALINFIGVLAVLWFLQSHDSRCARDRSDESPEVAADAREASAIAADSNAGDQRNAES